MSALALLTLMTLAFAIILRLVRPRNLLGALTAYILALSLGQVIWSLASSHWASATPEVRFAIALIGVPAVVLLGVRLLFGRAVYEQVLARLVYDVLRTGMRLIGLTLSAFLNYFGGIVFKIRSLIQAGRM